LNLRLVYNVDISRNYWFLKAMDKVPQNRAAKKLLDKLLRWAKKPLDYFVRSSDGAINHFKTEKVPSICATLCSLSSAVLPKRKKVVMIERFIKGATKTADGEVIIGHMRGAKS